MFVKYIEIMQCPSLELACLTQTIRPILRQIHAIPILKIHKYHKTQTKISFVLKP
jgi:hypothetical protein